MKHFLFILIATVFCQFSFAQIRSEYCPDLSYVTDDYLKNLDVVSFMDLEIYKASEDKTIRTLKDFGSRAVLAYDIDPELVVVDLYISTKIPTALVYKFEVEIFPISQNTGDLYYGGTAKYYVLHQECSGRTQAVLFKRNRL